MTLTTTFKRLRAAGVCTERYKFLRAALKGTKDTEPINLLTILEINGLDDALCALQATAENCDVPARLMAADFAEQPLPTWQKNAPNDKRPELAIKAARDFAYGRITCEELAAAAVAAWDARAAVVGHPARFAAGGANAAAWAAARDAADAARDAARYATEEKRREIFISYLQPEAEPLKDEVEK